MNSYSTSYERAKKGETIILTIKEVNIFGEKNRIIFQEVIYIDLKENDNA